MFNLFLILLPPVIPTSTICVENTQIKSHSILIYDHFSHFIRLKFTIIMDINSRVTPSFKVEVIDLTGEPFSNDEIIDLTQTSSDESTTQSFTSSYDEMHTSPDNDDNYSHQIGFLLPQRNDSNDSDYIPPAINWNVHHAAYDRSFENWSQALKQMINRSYYFTNFDRFNHYYSLKLYELEFSGKRSFRSTSFLKCIRTIVSHQHSENAFNPHFLKFTNPDRHNYLVDLKIKARLSPSPGNVHKLLSVKVCTWFASVESIHLTRSSFTFQDGPIATNFITCDPFHKWLHAQTDTIWGSYVDQRWFTPMVQNDISVIRNDIIYTWVLYNIIM